jgi:hypothetical protein
MTMRVCALLMKPPTEVEIALRLGSYLRGQAITLRPEWQKLSDIEIIEQVLQGLRDGQVWEAINKSSTTTKVGSLIEEK